MVKVSLIKGVFMFFLFFVSLIVIEFLFFYRDYGVYCIVVYVLGIDFFF